MPKEQDTNKRRYIQIGLKVAYYRKLDGMTQEELAEKVDISPNHLSKLERPSLAMPMSLKTLFTIADTLGIPPKRLLDFDE